MSQSSKFPSSKTTSNSDPRTPNINPNEVLAVAPLRMVSTEDLQVKKPRSPHARRPKEVVRGKSYNPSSSIDLENLTKEGSQYTHQAIAQIVTRVLDEQRQVLGISVPLQIANPDSTQNPNTNDKVNEKNDDEAVDVAQNVIDNTKNLDVQGNDVAADATQDVTDKNENDPNDDSGNNVVDLDDISNGELIANVNPSIAKRLMTRKGKKIADQSPPKRRVPKTTSTGPIRSKAGSKDNSTGPSKMDVQDIPLKKKPTSSKLAAKVPNVPIVNISFHSTSSVNRWKYVHQKRLALERELAQNALDCKDIMELIHAAGLMKTVTHFATCYEMLVKEFSVNLLEEYADRNSKEYRKVYVRGRCVTFSSTVINNYLGRSDDAQPELEVSNNKVCQVITANQVKSWPLKGKLSASKLSMRYAMLHKIGAANWVPTNHKSTIAIVLGRFIYTVGTKAKFDYGTYIFEQTMKHAGSLSIKGPIAFPSLICGIILN
ncbi:uncharacterized protein LOC131648903 [Vicia villosa]|uniref:uncharacterized protein LOC131648903 n=1 Tax=Vicia villosa TaxID=3911 RepID=UPI00273BD87E|nr:uncharacterized protein LOC131648903 [Vicia villosa]